MYALKIENLYKSFRVRKRTVEAVKGVSLEVGENETVGLLGMNGAGKSTTIKICSGLIPPDGGTVTVFDMDIVKQSEQAKSLINVSPQETAVAPMLSVRENLLLVSELYGMNKQDAATAANAMIERLKLGERANDRAGKLSGGLMRRLSIGMALITNPRLVFLDEPTLGLDVVARRELWKYIGEIKKTTAIVLTTHYLEEAEALCDRIAIMSHGEIAAVGTAAELTERAGEEKFEDAFLKLSGECANE
ncbi:MAG: ABC transporter ATP-binding protein [Clostridiales bacterium]|nr:ABC transporter ATP-binding protein [Clostridiales bacterium]